MRLGTSTYNIGADMDLNELINLCEAMGLEGLSVRGLICSSNSGTCTSSYSMRACCWKMISISSSLVGGPVAYVSWQRFPVR